MKQVIKLEFDYFGTGDTVFVPIQENIDRYNRFAGSDELIRTAQELIDCWNNENWGYTGCKSCTASIVRVITPEEAGYKERQLDMFPSIPKTLPAVFEINNEADTVICDEFDIVCFRETAFNADIFHTPFDEKPHEYWFCSDFALECSRGNIYGKDYCHSVCPKCDREFKHQNPENGWRWFAHHLSDEVICEKCWIEHLVENGSDIDEMLSEKIIPTTFFAKSDFWDNGYRESTAINGMTVGCGYFETVPKSRFFDKIKELRDEGFFDRYKVLFDTESAAIGGYGAVITMWVKSKNQENKHKKKITV